MSDLQKRKRLLIAECDVYRETLKLELQTFKIYGFYAKKRLKTFNTYMPFLLTAVPLLRSLFVARKKTGSWKRMGTIAWLGMQLYHRFGPIVREAFFQTRPPEKTAAEEYLSKRI